MPTPDTLDPIRQHLRGMWAAVAPGWARQIDYVESRGAAVNTTMLDRIALEPGDRVLELACGTGDAGLAAAARLGAAGSVVLSDVVPEMVAIAADRAQQLGRTNVTTAVLDIEDIDEPDSSYAVVLCREGLMFATDPDRGAREIHRVLRSGGRTAIAVWAERERNPWLGLVFDGVTAELGFPVPPPGVPGPFSLADADRLAALLRDAGFVDVQVDDLSCPSAAPDFETWWSRVSAMAGPLAKIIESLSPERTASLVDRLRASVAPYTNGAGIEIPGMTLVASGRRP